ncbi:Mitogen-activated protein kinase kinase kinase YODA [Linum perenne]
MPWWGKSSSKDEKKKATKESIIDAIQRKFRNATEDKGRGRTAWRRSRDVASEIGSLSRVPSRSPSPSALVSRCQSFAERSHAQPLPLPGVRGVHGTPIARSHSGVSESVKSGSDAGSKHLQVLPLPRTVNVSNRLDRVKLEVDIGTASVSSDSSSDSEDQSDSRLLSPLTSDYENGNRTAANSPSSMTQKDCSPLLSRKNSGEILKHSDFSLSNQLPSVSPRRAHLSSRVQNLQIPSRGTLFSAPDSSLSSPSRSPIRAFGIEQVVNTGLLQGKHYADVGLLGSGHCSSPGSGYNSGQNSIGGDLSGQLFWPNSRCSPECSPIPSPRMTSPGPSSRVQSGAVTPQHPRARGGLAESPRGRQEDGKQQSHRLPVPPITISNTCPFSPAYSAATSPSLPRSPNRAETPTSPGSRWKKGRPLGRGTFGDVFLGFNSESGEMCAMKEVTLFSDDAKSRESVQQLGQEIAMLSRLRHPNIVQYYGTETVEDKLYIYLEYVSGGSIHKLLQDYGAFGEIAIRTYTKQILSGLAYLHGKNTVHRDIKGANILVDPSGRVKVADFGMAKHITGQSCPLSFKGSPYWMAPEVIKNSSGCNLAVDIWSLGCTVLEMASGKPPWSQYEGVAAMFKIGNSRELPVIPDHLSDDGKDFIMQCLQRNPSHRPTSSQLLEHPFVKNIAPSERVVMTSESSEITATGRLMVHLGIVHARSFDTEAISIHQSGASRTGSGFSDFLVPRNNISCPVSPIGSPLQYPRSPQHMSGMRSPSPISSPHAASGASTPLTGGGSWQPASYIHETSGMVPRSQNGFYTGSSSPYREPSPDMFRQGLSQTSHIFRDMSSVDNNGGLGNQFGRFGRQDHREVPTSQPVLADRVSQQLLRDGIRLKPSLDLNPSSTTQCFSVQGDYMHQRSS